MAKCLFAFFFSALLIFVSTINYAQNELRTPYFIKTSFVSGKNKPHRPVIKNLTYPYRGVEVKLGWQSIGKQPWQVAYRYPSYGIGFNWSTFGTEIIGEPSSIFFFTNFPQLNSSWLNIDLEVDLGISHGINPYDEIKNPHNFSTGSTVNAFFGIYLEQSFHLGKKFDISISEGLTHYSNGAMGYPNLGLNIIPTIKVGIKDHPEYPKKINKGQKPDYKNNWQMNVYVGGGIKKLFGPTPTYREVLISPSIYYRTGYKRRIGVAYDITYNEAITGIWTRKEEMGSDLITQAALVSHEYIINRFTILTQFGFYVNNLPFDKNVYNRFDIDCIISRLGISYYITPWARAVLNVKAHYIKAEFVETGIIFDIKFN